AQRALTSLRSAVVGDGLARPLRPLGPSVDRELRRRVDDLLAAVALAPLDEPSRARAPFITATAIALVLIHVVVTRLGDPSDPNFLLRVGGLRSPIRDAEESWRLITYALLHGGWEHLAFNVLALWSLGRFVEAFFGTPVAALIFVLGAVLSGLAVHALADEAHARVLVGASGAIFAMGGAALSAIALRRDLRGTRRGRSLLQNLIVAFAAQALLDRMVPAISQTAHLAGLASGLLLGAVFLPRKRA
ncbi:MAG: rhomboid family intramembrane serine protease, partial [Polyangiales bacterium]